MKIAVWIVSDYKPHIGGGFSLYDKIIQSIDDFKFSNGIEVCFTGHKPASEYNFKKEYICINTLVLNIPFVSKLILKYSHKINFIGKRESKKLKKENIDLIYYPVQGLKKVNNFPFASANWDTGHLSGFAFPEVAMNGKFEYREKWYSNEIHKALMVFAESESGKEELLFYTKLNPDRIGIVPLFPAEVINLKVSELEQNNYLSKYNLASGKFFFYPAQFWAHKNHYNLLLAFQKYSSAYPEVKLVLSGSDKGNKKYIVDSAKELGLESKVLFAGFIDNECLYTFYKHALAMVFPGILGPTNMPLLEARMLDCPVLCSDIKGHREIMGDGALYFNPLNSADIAESLRKVSIENERAELLKKAGDSLRNNFFTTENALKALDENFIKLKSIRQTWGKSERIF